MPLIDPHLATVDHIQLAIGQALKTRIEADGTITRFGEQHGVGKTSLYRLFSGEGISFANLIRLLRGLGMHDVIATLLAPPAESPIEAWKAQAPVRSAGNIAETSSPAYGAGPPSGKAAVKSMLAKPKRSPRS